MLRGALVYAFHGDVVMRDFRIFAGVGVKDADPYRHAVAL
jgi:hypothetical protein